MLLAFPKVLLWEGFSYVFLGFGAKGAVASLHEDFEETKSVRSSSVQVGFWWFLDTWHILAVLRWAWLMWKKELLRCQEFPRISWYFDSEKSFYFWIAQFAYTYSKCLIFVNKNALLPWLHGSIGTVAWVCLWVLMFGLSKRPFPRLLMGFDWVSY